MEKLKPNERDVWVAAYRGQLLRGDHIAGARVFADNAVEAARERGAFDADGSVGVADTKDVLAGLQRFIDATGALHARVPASLPSAHAAIATTLRDQFPEAFDRVYEALRNDTSAFPMWQAIVKFREGSTITTYTPRAMLPWSVGDARQELARRSLLSDVTPAAVEDVRHCQLIPLSPRGVKFCMDVLAHGWESALCEVPIVSA